MKNIIKDILENCPECDCDIEKTIEFLNRHGDLSYTSEHYREIWFFYLELLESLGSKKQARETTIELYNISFEKFRKIRKWWNRTK